jgi:hypothetical protein
MVWQKDSENFCNNTTIATRQWCLLDAACLHGNVGSILEGNGLVEAEICPKQWWENAGMAQPSDSPGNHKKFCN